MPISEMTAGIHKYLWPIELPTTTGRIPNIMRACQALALMRSEPHFTPQLWDESDEESSSGKNCRSARAAFHQGRARQPGLVAGVHTNVGGGYPDDSLAYIPLSG